MHGLCLLRKSGREGHSDGAINVHMSRSLDPGVQKRRPWDFHMSFPCWVVIGLFSPSLKFSLVCSGSGRSGEMGPKRFEEGAFKHRLTVQRTCMCSMCSMAITFAHGYVRL